MSFNKRSRAVYEADQQNSARSTHVLFGTPLPDSNSNTRDDGSYVPVWKQEVKDERGRKRLHGAFTGGWSAGYFNTVGSKEGWTPSPFVSSRSSRGEKSAQQATHHRPEDFMDEEDLQEAAAAQKLRTADSFTGLGGTSRDGPRPSAGPLSGLLQVGAQNMGIKLLQKMGWRQGKGVGAKVRRQPRLGLRLDSASGGQSYLFAPEDLPMVRFDYKSNHIGLGFRGEEKLSMAPLSITRASIQTESEEEVSRFARLRTSKPGDVRQHGCRSGFGTGIFNETDSDDEDLFEIGPRIGYNKAIGSDEKKKQKFNSDDIVSNLNSPSLSTPRLTSRKTSSSRTLHALRKCHDGRLPTTGFVFGSEPDALVADIVSCGKHGPPVVPPGWQTAKTGRQAGSTRPSEPPLKTRLAMESKSNPAWRAEILGERALPGKSVFDFLSSSARDRLAAASGKANLPPGRGRASKEHVEPEEEKDRRVLRQTPKLDKETAIAAISRGASAGARYMEDGAKQSRYQIYLEYYAGYSSQGLARPQGMSVENWLAELQEFHGCAKIFKPMAGVIASRFTTSSAGAAQTPDAKTKKAKTTCSHSDAAVQGSRLGMYGSITRTIRDFAPTRLLCKRFNVKPPAHVQLDSDLLPPQARRVQSPDFGREPSSLASHAAQVARNRRTQDDGVGGLFANENPKGKEDVNKTLKGTSHEVSVDAGKNEAIEQPRAHTDVFRAVFGDSDEDAK